MGRTSDARERLLATMAQLVHAQGYEAVSVDRICTSAGVKKGSFYHFFPSKQALMLAALERTWDAAESMFLATAFDPELPPKARIERFFTMTADFETQAKQSRGSVLGCPFGNLSAERSGTDATIRHKIARVFDGFAGRVAQAIEDARSVGELPRTVDARASAEAVLAYFEGVMLVAKTRNDPQVIRDLAPGAVRLAGWS